MYAIRSYYDHFDCADVYQDGRAEEVLGGLLAPHRDEVTIHCNYVDMQAPDGHDDSMLDPDQRIWGFETNFGGLAEIALVRANQLIVITSYSIHYTKLYE